MRGGGEMIPYALWVLLEAVIFPGFAFMAAMVILTQWIHRKVGARIQYRRGPMYTGYAGTLQPLADFLKLLFKEDLVSRYSLRRSPLLMLSLGIGALVTLVLMTPLAPRPIYSEFDIIVFLYLALFASLAILYLAISSPNPYTSLGVGRYLALLVGAEPPYAASFLVPAVLGATAFSGAYSVYLTSIRSHLLWGGGVANVLVMAIATFSAFLSMLAVMEVKPFDFPEAEGEIYWGLFTEYGGPRLALAFFILFMERIVLPLFFVLLFLGGSWPVDISQNYILGFVVILLKFLAVFTLISVIDNMMPRFRPDQGVRFLLKYALPLSLLSLVAAALI